MFRSKSIILHTQKIRDNQSRIILFTREYGKVSVWYKKRDIPLCGSIIQALIERKGESNTLCGFDINILPEIDGWRYKEIIALLSIVESLYYGLPEGSPHTNIFDSIEEGFLLIKNNYKNRYQLLLLIHVRIMKMLGYLKDSFYKKDSLLAYIYKNIDIYPIKSIKIEESLLSTNIHYISRSLQEAREYIGIS